MGRVSQYEGQDDGATKEKSDCTTVTSITLEPGGVKRKEKWNIEIEREREDENDQQRRK